MRVMKEKSGLKSIMTLGYFWEIFIDPNINPHEENYAATKND